MGSMAAAAFIGNVYSGVTALFIFVYKLALLCITTAVLTYCGLWKEKQ